MSSKMLEQQENQDIVMNQEACQKAAELLASRDEKKYLRLYLDGKGCDGFYYGITFAEKAEDDQVFTQQIPDVKIIVDPKTLEFVQGATISWSKHEDQEGFLVSNPRQRRYRGKFYKRKFWQERLKSGL
jgi:iron-sulfur cluster assembly accessory protein